MEPYHTNLSKRMVKTPKLYFLDSELAANLTEYFYRNKDQKKIDMLIVRVGTLYPSEIKKTHSQGVMRFGIFQYWKN